MKIKRFFGKKAAITGLLDFLLLQLIPIAVIIVFTLAYIHIELEDTNMARLYLSRDISIEMNPIYGVPGNIEEIYFLPIKYHLGSGPTIHKYNFSFDNNFVDVNGKKFPYAENSNVFRIYQLTNITDNLNFWLHGEYLHISNIEKLSKEQPKFYRFKKPSIPFAETADKEWKTKTISIIPESEPFVAEFHRAYDRELNLKKQITPGSVVQLEIIFEDSSDIISEIQYSSALKSRKLASILINSLVDEAENKGKNPEKIYIKVNNENYDAESAVKLRIGKKLGFEFGALNKIIFKGLERYFE